ncbi:MAG: hypothetical protein QXE70_04340 [Ignisphaera sp.]
MRIRKRNECEDLCRKRIYLESLFNNIDENTYSKCVKMCRSMVK